MPVKELTLLQLNDSHAYFNLHPEQFWEGDASVLRPAGGYSRLARLMNDIRAERPGKVLALDGGDTFHGTYAAVQTQGQALVPVLQALAFDAMTAHWDFAYGPHQLKRLAEQVGYPVLALNVTDPSSGEHFFDPHLVRSLNGLRVGIIGLAAWIVGKMMPDKFSQGLRFTLGHEELPDRIHHLRTVEKVDLVVVLSHLGFPQDMRLAQETPGIHVILSSHTHNRLYAPVRVNDTLIIQSGSHGSFLGRLDLEVESGRIVDYRHQLRVVDEQLEPDPAVQELVDQALAPYQELLCEPVGRTRSPLARDRVLESSMDNFLLQALLDHTGAELAFSNGWRYGAPIPAGTITRDHLYNIIPVNPPVSLVELTGEEVWTLWEENLEHTFACDPYRQMGGYVKRGLGQNVYFKLENPAGHRIQEIFIQGKPLQPERSYQAVFVTTQGVPARLGQNRHDLEIRAVEALERYLARAGEVQVDLHGTLLPV